MAYQKSYRLLVFLGIFLFLFSCTKYRKEIEVVEVEAKNPVTGIPISGVKFEIYQVKTKSGFLGSNEQVESELIHEGATDTNGYARYEFTPMYKDGKKMVDHWIKFNYNNMDVPPGDYEILRGLPNETGTYFTGSGSESALGGNYFFDIQIAPNLSVIKHIKNLNCFDGNDKIRYKIRHPHTWGNWFDWAPDPNLSSGFFYVCGDSTVASFIAPQDSVYLEIEVTRNNIVTTIRDSMLLDPSKTQDTIKIYF